jgi:NADP-dependent 3-hydroxy acid dehydrogenase YdfG
VVSDKNIASREQLIKEAHDVKERAKRSDKLQVELNAIDVKGKLAGIYRNQSESTGQFERIIQMFQVNVEVNNEGKEEAIDVTPEMEGND